LPKTERDGMGLIDKLKNAGEQATASARVSLHEAELTRDLDHAYSELGRIAYVLLARGEVTNEQLAPAADRVRALEHELAALTSPTRRPSTL
jgi:hypothetical protein